jgi:hypothetical protein
MFVPFRSLCRTLILLALQKRKGTPDRDSFCEDGFGMERFFD